MVRGGGALCAQYFLIIVKKILRQQIKNACNILDVPAIFSDLLYCSITCLVNVFSSALMMS